VKSDGKWFVLETMLMFGWWYGGIRLLVPNMAQAVDLFDKQVASAEVSRR